MGFHISEIFVNLINSQLRNSALSASGGRLTSWRFTQPAEELNSGLPRTNPDSGRWRI